MIAEIKRGSYDLVLLGAVDRIADKEVHLGQIVERVKLETTIPSAILVVHAHAKADE